MSHVSASVYYRAGDLPTGELWDDGDGGKFAQINLGDGAVLGGRSAEGTAYLRELAAVATRLADEMERKT